MNRNGPVRILFPFTAKSLGGAHFSTLNLIRNLDRRHFEPVVLLHMKGAMSAYLRDHGVPHRVVRVPCRALADFSLAQGFEALRTVPPLVHFLSKNKIDIVHTNENRTHQTWAAPVRLTGTKFVLHLRTTLFSNGSRTFERLANNADRIACVSRYIRDTVPERLRERARVIYNPFDTLTEAPDREQARHRLVDELGCPPDTAIVGFFANFAERKRPQMFVEAAGRICAALGRPAVFLMFGEDKQGYSRALTRRAQAMGIADRLRLMGFRLPAEEFMAACDLMLIPAVDEPFGRTLVEAALVGTPVVATRSGGNFEFLRDGETGTLVAPDDPEALAQAALRILKDPEAARALVERGRAESRDRLNIAAHVDQVSALYRDLMQEATRSDLAPAA